MNRILLTDEDFAALVAGKIIGKNGAQFALQDIGFDRMHKHIDDVELKQYENDY